MSKSFLCALALVLLAVASVNAQNGASNQTVEMEYGTTDISYALRDEKPIGKECGGGLKDLFFPDRVLVFNTPARGTGNPDNIRFWSTLAHVRVAMSVAYKGKLAAAGLSTKTTRVCVGSWGRHFSLNDYKYIYLWRRVLIAGR